MSDPTPNPDPQPTPSPEPDPKPTKVEFTPEQNEWISKKIAYELKSAQEKRDAADAQAKKDAEAEAERKRQEAAGEFDKVRQSLEGERDTFKSQAEAATAELTTLREYVTADIAAAVKDLPKALVAFDPGEDAPIKDRLDWLTKAKANAAEITASGTPGNGPNPKPAGNVKPEIPSALPKQRLFS